MKQALLNFLTFLFLSPLLFAQTVQLKGKIIDAQTAQPLAFVHIGIPAQGIGTASSETGAYSFYFSIDFLDDELEISHLGYYSQRFQLSELDMSKEFIIRLEPQLKLLDEVEVIGTEQPLVYFVEKAIKNFKKNYPNKLHYMTGFYRQATINRETINYMRVLEAAVDIQDPGIYKPTSNIKLKVKELRKSDDNLPLNYREELYRKRYGKRNELYRILVSNEIRGYKEMIHFNGSILNLMKRFPDKLTLKGVTYYDGRKVYIIELNHVIYDATIYLDSEDYGIYKYTTLLMPGYSKKYEKDFNPKGFDSFVQYRRVNGQYQLSLVRSVNLGPILDSEKGKKYSFGYEFITLLINKFYTDKKEFDRIKSKVAIENTGQKMFDLNYPYNENFWNTFNLVDLEPLDPKVKNDLELKESLEVQFKRNGQ